MKKFLGIFLGVVIILFVLGGGGLYWLLSNPSTRQSFAASFVASGRPAFLKSCVESAHRAAAAQGPEIDQRIERACNCAADKMMSAITSQDSFSKMGSAIYRMVADGAYQQQVAEECLAETR